MTIIKLQSDVDSVDTQSKDAIRLNKKLMLLLAFPHPATFQEFPDAEIHVYERSEHVGGRARVFQHGRHSYEAQDAIGVPRN